MGWASPTALECHVQSSHAQRFNAIISDGDMLVCEPSLTIFGDPLSENDLRVFASTAKSSKSASMQDGSRKPPPVKGGSRNPSQPNCRSSGYTDAENTSRPDSSSRTQ